MFRTVACSYLLPSVINKKRNKAVELFWYDIQHRVHRCPETTLRSLSFGGGLEGRLVVHRTVNLNEQPRRKEHVYRSAFSFMMAARMQSRL